MTTSKMHLRRYEATVAMLTAAASGIGRATAVRLSLEGAFVVAIDIDPAVKDLPGSVLPNSEAFVVDCCDRKAVVDTFRELDAEQENRRFGKRRWTNCRGAA